MAKYSHTKTEYHNDIDTHIIIAADEYYPGYILVGPKCTHLMWDNVHIKEELSADRTVTRALHLCAE